MATAKESAYHVVWPKGEKTLKLAEVSNRLDTLAGKTTGLLWDYVFRGNEIFAIIQKGLAERFPGIKFVNCDRFGNGLGTSRIGT